ncbi:hypothetical protein KY495_10800 [Massilia sp. PAMC28688]|uniref:DUF6941 family protein n=1 Tax=Massilia sp. PAMC28688 TaxID=2861283 RepID=UPI001C635B7E|nr:hypothetical protein [Massilia sp. PAMC28688]QYF95588.1 hypothetical protein KY495_10800 [Massilia sp. PAMC28688]
MSYFCPRFIHTLYCDDVRQEVGGKMTFVGAYQSQMLAEQPGELTLPKLCIVLTAQTPHEQPFQKMLIKLFRDDEILQQMDVPVMEQLPVNVSDGRPANFDVRGIIITLQGLKFEKSAVLRIQVETEAEVLSAPGFQVTLKNEGATQASQDQVIS